MTSMNSIILTILTTNFLKSDHIIREIRRWSLIFHMIKYWASSSRAATLMILQSCPVANRKGSTWRINVSSELSTHRLWKYEPSGTFPADLASVLQQLEIRVAQSSIWEATQNIYEAHFRTNDASFLKIGEQRQKLPKNFITWLKV